MQRPVRISRRAFAAGSVASVLAGRLGRPVSAASTPTGNPTGSKVCAFVKYLQTMSYDDLAEAMAAAGFDGIEATVRDKGQILPERVEGELPKLVEALKRRGLEITVMATSIGRADERHTEKVLRTAASLGVKRYRMIQYHYDLTKPVLPQLDAWKPVVRDLVAMSRELGLTVLYQNHSGVDYVGAVVWDLHYLMRDYPPSDFAVAFDIRHATVEGGLAWPVHFNLMTPHLGAVYVKDFAWEGGKPKNVPLGKGQVDPRFFGMLRKMAYAGPISVHVEYLENEGNPPNVEALRTDVATLRKLMGGA